MKHFEVGQIQLLHEAYGCYRDNNLISSQKAFSVRILGQAPSYYSSMGARNRTPSRSVIKALLGTTMTIMAALRENPNFGKPYAQNLNSAHSELAALAQRLSAHVELQSTTEKLM